jgi:hypothetical protein
MSPGPWSAKDPGNPWCDGPGPRRSVLPMDATTGAETASPPHLPWSPPLRLGLAYLADECVMLAAQLDRDLEPLHRLGEELMARLGDASGGTARMA